MKQLAPIILREKYFIGIEKEIKRLLDELIYKPLVRALEIPMREIYNTGNALLNALQAGTVWYREGHFYGQFNSRITKDLRALGAVYNAPSRTWSLEAVLVPADVRFAQASADSRYDVLRRQVLRTIDDMQIASIAKHSETTARYGKAIEWMEGDFTKTVKAISIPPTLTDTQRELLAAEWGQNLDLYIKDWASEEILKLREKVQISAFQGGRAEGLVNYIQQSYGVSRTKAQFLARQETSLLMSTFQKNRYRDIGIQRYRWSGANDARERPDHKALNGKVFSWDMPPITDRRTGARNNPGEDYNCRCIAIPLVE